MKGPCAAISARKARDVAEFARADAGMVTEEAREMRGLRKTEALAKLAEWRVLAHHRVQRTFHPHHIEIELWRDAERGLEQAEKLRAGQAGPPHELTDARVGIPATHGIHRAPDPPVAAHRAHAPDRVRKAAPGREPLDHRDHEIRQRLLMGPQGIRMRHHVGGKLQGELADARRNLTRGPLEEAGRTAGGPSRSELLQPFGLDIE